MDIPLQVPGFEGHSVALRPSAWRGARVLLDDQPVPRSGRVFKLALQSGASAEIKLKPAFLDPIPNVEINGQHVQTRPDLTAVQKVFVYLPFALVAFGGAVGGGLGGGAAFLSARVFRSERPDWQKYALSVAATCAAVLAWLVLAVFIQSLRH